MRQIEARVFAAGMPVAALMEKVGGLIAQRVQYDYPLAKFPRIGILVGPGHNGGDALVVARELQFRGYHVQICHPFNQAKDLTASHLKFAHALGIPISLNLEKLSCCDVYVDGLFGFGLERNLTGKIAELVQALHQLTQPIISIDLPSGLHTDTGQILGVAVPAQHTLCLGLWKLGLLQDHALAVVGQAELIDIDLPPADITAVLGTSPTYQRITPTKALGGLPLQRPAATHKYQQGHTLLVGSSQTYGGSLLLAGLAARSTGVGMLTLAVPASLKALYLSHLPDALIVGCPETPTGAIAQLPETLNLAKFAAIGCGPGLTTDVPDLMSQLIASDRPLVIDADGLNLLAHIDPVAALANRTAPTILTPHAGEFQRLFPELSLDPPHHLASVQTAARNSGAIVLLKGARVTIATPTQQIWINPASSPALARGGSGDVLTGLISGLLAQGQEPLSAVLSATWWHAQAGISTAQQRTSMGVDATTLTQMLLPSLREFLAQMPKGS
jgi:ADP-dependent NAD(P)H-hydrate dehydratase / NAD(P)H-hydrate epimerase